MSLAAFVQPFPWGRYSKKLQSKILHPHSAGRFTKEGADERSLRLAEGAAGALEEGNIICLYWLVDREEGKILDAKFQAWGQSALIGAAEAVSALVIGKNYDQARRITADLLDKELRDRPDHPAFPPETYPHLNLVIEAVDRAAEQCGDLPLPSAYVAPPAPTAAGEASEYPGFVELSLEKKLAVIEQVLDSDVRPYIALDAGGVSVLNLLEGKEVVISYSGACTSCYSSVGATLSYIQQTLQRKVHPGLTVTPDVDFTSPYG